MANIRDMQCGKMSNQPYRQTTERTSGRSSRASAKSKTARFLFLNLRNGKTQDWSSETDDEDDSHLDLFSLELFENIAYIMAKHADPSIPDSPEEWLDEFSTFSIYQILPQLIELWGLNTEVEIDSKKKLDRLSAK